MLNIITYCVMNGVSLYFCNNTKCSQFNCNSLQLLQHIALILNTELVWIAFWGCQGKGRAQCRQKWTTGMEGRLLPILCVRYVLYGWSINEDTKVTASCSHQKKYDKRNLVVVKAILLKAQTLKEEEQYKIQSQHKMAFLSHWIQNTAAGFLTKLESSLT